MPEQKNRRYRPQSRAMSKKEREALKARQERKERNIREQREAAAGRVSYVRKPVSARSIVGMVLTLIAYAFGAYCLYLAYDTYGQVPFSAGGSALCSMICALAALAYHTGAMREHESNRILAKIGLVLTAVLLLAWAAVVMIGMKGE